MHAQKNRSQAARRGGRVLAAAIATVMLVGSTPASADEYDSDRTGHPLRILAYIVHPIGVILDTLIMRPAHWLGSRESVKKLVGHERGD